MTTTQPLIVFDHNDESGELKIYSSFSGELVFNGNGFHVDSGCMLIAQINDGIRKAENIARKEAWKSISELAALKADG